MKCHFFWLSMPVSWCLWQSWIQFANFYILFCNPVQGEDLAAAQVGQGTGWGAGAAQRLQWVEQNWASRTEANDFSSAMHSPEKKSHPVLPLFINTECNKYATNLLFGSCTRHSFNPKYGIWVKIVDLIKDPIDLLVNLIVIVIVCSVNSENNENSLGSVKCGATSISDGIFRYQ